MLVRACCVRCAGVGVEQAILDCPMRVVAIGALGVPIGDSASRACFAQDRLGFHEVLAALVPGGVATPGRAGGEMAITGRGAVIEFAADVVCLGLSSDGHADGQAKIGFNVGHLARRIDLAEDRCAIGAVALEASLLDRRVATALWAGDAIGSFAQQSPRALDGMGVVTA